MPIVRSQPGDLGVEGWGVITPYNPLVEFTYSSMSQNTFLVS